MYLVFHLQRGHQVGLCPEGTRREIRAPWLK